MNYSAYEFLTKDEIERSWLISVLSDYHFEGFEETEESLKAFVPVDKISHLDIPEILRNEELGHIPFSTENIEEKNWNEEWEKNFPPVVIAERVGIRAPFHEPLNTEYEIVIEPKMSFGTGHHATTAGVIELMLGERMEGKSVLDFGSGTGVLAVLAEKLNAAKILAIDHEEWAYRNCVENIERNHCVHIRPIHGNDTFAFSEKFDVILANINRPVILANLAAWKQLMAKNGIMIVSGILLNDEKEVVAEANKQGLDVKNILRNNGWLAISFQQL